VLGQLGGQQSHTLNISELPAHTHSLVGLTVGADTTLVNGNTPNANVMVAEGVAAQASGASTPVTIYSSANPSALMNQATIVSTGGNQPHENMSPYLVLNFIIALQGIFPSQN
jgi:microcystin-dependent protein